MSAVIVGMSVLLAGARPSSSEQPTATRAPAASAPAPSRESESFAQSLQKQALPELIHSLTDDKDLKTPGAQEEEGDAEDLRATPYLLRAYQEARHEGIRCKLLQSIGKLRDPSLFDWLVLRLKDPSINIQCFAIWALGELRLPKAKDPLLRKLWSPSPYVQMTAMDALGKTGKNPDVATVLAVFLNDDDIQRRYLAAKALAGTAGPEAVPELIDHLVNEPSLDVQDALAKTLGEMGGPVAAAHFIELLKKPLSQATEHWAELALKSSKPSIVIPALVPLVEGSDFRLKVSALRILTELDVSNPDDNGIVWIPILRRWAKGSDLISREASSRLLEKAEAARAPQRAIYP